MRDMSKLLLCTSSHSKNSDSPVFCTPAGTWAEPGAATEGSGATSEATINRPCDAPAQPCTCPHPAPHFNNGIRPILFDSPVPAQMHSIYNRASPSVAGRQRRKASQICASVLRLDRQIGGSSLKGWVGGVGGPCGAGGEASLWPARRGGPSPSQVVQSPSPRRILAC